MLVKLRFDQNSNEHKKFKQNQKNEKPPHIVLLCHILTIQVHLGDLDKVVKKLA